MDVGCVCCLLFVCWLVLLLVMIPFGTGISLIRSKSMHTNTQHKHKHKHTNHNTPHRLRQPTVCLQWFLSPAFLMYNLPYVGYMALHCV